MISVITPTYNRGYCLRNLYISLQEQTEKDFEWIIVDDGSSDDTEQIVKEWLNAGNLFKINYYKQDNGGKHRALNKAIKMAQGEFCFFVDSDDVLVPNAISLVNNWISKIGNEMSFAGVAGTRGHDQNHIIGEFPNGCDYIDASNIDRARKGLMGDKAEVYRTDILLQYPFPEFIDEKFLPEAAVWDQIAHDGYKLRWYKDVIYLCEYLEDGLTKNSDNLILKNFEGYTFVCRNKVKYYPFPYNWVALVVYIYYARKKQISGMDIIHRLNLARWEYMLGCLVYFPWKIRRCLKDGNKAKQKG